MDFNIAIVGRPNVGKSTLFNRLCGLKVAIVDPTPGVTRDRRVGRGGISDLNFQVVDTAGVDEDGSTPTEKTMQEQTRLALKGANLVLFLFDSRAGITPLDKQVATLLRKSSCEVVLLANKAEGRIGKIGLYDAFELGLGEAIPISAEHGEGMLDLYEAIQPHVDLFDKKKKNEEVSNPLVDSSSSKEDRIKLAIVGRPNVGKSTLFNHLLGEERVITSPHAGTTRDSISVEWQWRKFKFELFDTAGMRRRAKISEKIEKLSVADTLRAIRFAEVVILVMEPGKLGERQDFSIASHVVSEGRSMVIAVNKWDLVADQRDPMEKLKDRIQKSLPQLKGVPIVPVSAIEGSGTDLLIQTATKVFDIWQKRIPTGPLNRWLENMLQSHPPPISGGRRLKLRFITQVKARPPSFVLFTTRPGALPESYSRYLINGLRERFDLWGVPIRLTLRQGQNPYVD